MSMGVNMKLLTTIVLGSSAAMIGAEPAIVSQREAAPASASNLRRGDMVILLNR
jgi:hypothetical protein